MMNGKSSQGHTWAIVLAAGSGTRLSSLTRDASGTAVPKQFCSLDGGPSLIRQALARARSVVSKDRITSVVCPAHVRYWRPALSDLSPENIVVQPYNRGTAVGILLPTLSILARDPEARILVLPSDHHVVDEAILEDAMRHAIDEADDHPAGVVLLGIEAQEPDPELGYIVPCAGNRSKARLVQRFVEKPSLEDARRLCDEGALWNSFILVSRAQNLVELYRRRRPDVVQALQAIQLREYAQLLQVYCDLPDLDFSRHIATDQEQRLAVIAVPPCGWNDLGTPHRLAQTLARRVQAAANDATAKDVPGGGINLSERLQRTHASALHRQRSAVVASRL